MTHRSITIEAIFDNGMLRPVQPLPLRAQQRVTLTLHLSGTEVAWPSDVAAIYQEIAEEERQLAEAMMPAVQETWPISEEKP